MSGKASEPAGTRPAPDGAGGGGGDAGSGRPRHIGPAGFLALGRRRQRSGQPAASDRLKCPDCGLPITDPAAARFGFCGRCQEFTAMCGAGRKIVCPDMMA
jgi:hypothetical protein